MYRHILIPTDGSELSQKAVEHGIAMAKSLNAKVTVVTVSPPFHTLSVEPGMVTDTRAEYERHAAASAAKYLKAGREAASAVDVTVDTASLGTLNPALDTHLKSKDFLDVAAFPTATFHATKVTQTG